MTTIENNLHNQLIHKCKIDTQISNTAKALGRQLTLLRSAIDTDLTKILKEDITDLTVELKQLEIEKKTIQN